MYQTVTSFYVVLVFVVVFVVVVVVVVVVAAVRCRQACVCVWHTRLVCLFRPLERARVPWWW